MFCEKCGNQIKENAVFCSNCGNRLAGEAADKSIAEPKEVIRKQKKGGILKYVLIGIGVLTVACICFLWSGGNSTENIDLVRNGFLGEYTDVTVEELLNTNLGLSGFHLKWAEAEMDGKDYVGFYSYMDGQEPEEGTTILFQICSDKTFKVSGYAQGGNENFESTKIADFFNNYYMNWHVKNRISPDATEDEIMDDMSVLIHERFDKISGTEVLYGASESYYGERWNLCREIDGESPIDMTVTELINYYNDNMLDAYTVGENALEEQDDTYENEIDDEVNDEETHAEAKEFNLEWVKDKNYINGTDEGCFEIDFFVEDSAVLFSLYSDGNVLVKKAEATIVDDGTLHFEGYDDWNIDFVWNEEASFCVNGTGAEIADMIGTEFFDTSEYAP